MEDHVAADTLFFDKEHQPAYIFDPSNLDGSHRPSKRRKVFQKQQKEERQTPHDATYLFHPLFEGTESEECVQFRWELYERSWSRIDKRIRHVLRQANQSTLDGVTAFVGESRELNGTGKIPSAFIITGANIAPQELLFEQLSENIQESLPAKVVRLRSADASNLKAALKKIISYVTSGEAQDEDENDLELAVSKDGRRYLNYDLEAMYSYLKTNPRDRIVISFQDSEAFETSLLSDLILLFSAWLDRIPFTLLFGVATSIEFFQARLLKSTCQHLYGDQFDVEQSASVIERIFKTAVAHVQAPLQLGPSLLQNLLERHRDQVAGVSIFISSIKYAYMCHFYANPLALLLDPNLDYDLLQEYHLEVIRSLPSFRAFVESSLEEGHVDEVRLLLDDDDHLKRRVQEQVREAREWRTDILRMAKIMTAGRLLSIDFTQHYLDTLLLGVDVEDHASNFIDSVQRLEPKDAILFINQLLKLIEDGDPAVGLRGWAKDSGDVVQTLSKLVTAIQAYSDEAEENGVALRSKYNGRKTVLRTTVVAQKVQLSQDTATLTDADKEYTAAIDRVVSQLKAMLKAPRAEALWLHEIWLYDSDIPYKDVFVPQPRSMTEQALLQPHDYLSCTCCESADGRTMPTLPATAIVYQIYLEAGSLINVADLWTAFYGVIGREGQDGGLDERTALVLFYRALSELRMLGFVKQSRKKADHISKLAWRGL